MMSVAGTVVAPPVDPHVRQLIQLVACCTALTCADTLCPEAEGIHWAGSFLSEICSQFACSQEVLEEALGAADATSYKSKQTSCEKTSASNSVSNSFHSTASANDSSTGEPKSLEDQKEISSSDISLEKEACDGDGIYDDFSSDEYVEVVAKAKMVRELGDEVSLIAAPDTLGHALRLIVIDQARRRTYDARVRGTLKRAVRALTPYAFRLDVWQHVIEVEAILAKEDPGLLSEHGQNKKKPSVSKKWKVGATALSSGALLVYTGGLAAPSIVVASICAVPSLVAWFATPVATGTAAISSIFGVTGASLAGYKMGRRVAGVKEFRFIPLFSITDANTNKIHPTTTGVDTCTSTTDTPSTEHASSGLPVFICVPGWHDSKRDPRDTWGGRGSGIHDTESGLHTGKDEEEHPATAEENYERPLERDESWDVCVNSVPDIGQEPCKDADRGSPGDSWESVSVLGAEGGESSSWWRKVVSPGGEELVLVWETSATKAFKEAMKEMVWHSASRRVLGECVRKTVLGPVLSSAAIPMAVLKLLAGLDDPWTVALARAKKCGVLLAETLLQRPRGLRPVLLLGYSMGARVIFSCLEKLALAGEKGRGIIETVVLMGAPVGTTSKRWRAVRTVVADRLINCYSTRDWVLALIFRSKSLKMGIAGTSPVEGSCVGVENIDISKSLSWHLAYPKILPNVLAQLKIEFI